MKNLKFRGLAGSSWTLASFLTGLLVLLTVASCSVTDTPTESPPSVNVEWPLLIGGRGADYINGIAADDSGNLYVVGNSTSSSLGATINSGEDAFIAKISAISGAVLWTRILSGSNGDYGYGIAVTSDSSHLYVCGYTSSSNFVPEGLSLGSVGSAGWVVNIDSASGTVNWVRCTEPPSEGYVSLSSIVALPADGGYVASGSVNAVAGTVFNSQSLGGGADVLIQRGTSSGVVSWNTSFGSEGYDQAKCIALATADGSTIVGGSTTSASFLGDASLDSDSYNNDGFVLRVQSNGIVSQHVRVGGSGPEEGIMAVAPASDGGILFCAGSYSNPYSGYTYPSTGGLKVGILGKLDPAGSTTWLRAVPGNGSLLYLGSIIEAGNGDVVACGNQYSSGLDSASVLVRFTATGDLLWRTSPLYRIRSTGLVASGGAFYMGGSTDLVLKLSSLGGGSDGVIVRMTADGEF